MRVINWPELLRDNGIPHIDRGPNVKRGEVNIKCPFCGSADPSYHMGLNLINGWWSCWRRRDVHSGKSPLRLIMALLGCSYERAREIAGLGPGFIDPEGFDALKARLMGTAPPPAAPRTSVEFPFDLITGLGGSRRHFDYLHRQRGFSERHVLHVINRYRLAWARSGPQASRIIMPYIVGGKVVTWTGRAIAASSARYLDMPLDESAANPKDVFYNQDALDDPATRDLVLVEGPVDVIKLDYYGFDAGVRAVGMSTATPSEAQLNLIASQRQRWRRLIVMSDQTASGLGYFDSAHVRAAMAHVPGVEVMVPPFNMKDCGALMPGQALRFVDDIANHEGPKP